MRGESAAAATLQRKGVPGLERGDELLGEKRADSEGRSWSANTTPSSSNTKGVGCDRG